MGQGLLLGSPGTLAWVRCRYQPWAGPVAEAGRPDERGMPAVGWRTGCALPGVPWHRDGPKLLVSPGTGGRGEHPQGLPVAWCKGLARPRPQAPASSDVGAHSTGPFEPPGVHTWDPQGLTKALIGAGHGGHRSARSHRELGNKDGADERGAEASLVPTQRAGPGDHKSLLFIQKKGPQGFPLSTQLKNKSGEWSC